jgi:hypothetical protein
VVLLTAEFAWLWNNAKIWWEVSVDIHARESTHAFYATFIHIFSYIVLSVWILSVELIAICIDKRIKNKESIQ